MKIGISIQILWPLAVEEAAAGRAGEIEPGHLVCAALKVVEIEPRALRKAIQDPRRLQAFEEERKNLAQTLKQRSIAPPEDSARIRRGLRKFLRSKHAGGRPPADGVMHRSPESRAAFSRAKQKCRDGAGLVQAGELLEAIFDEPGETLTAALEQLGVPGFGTDSKDSAEWIAKFGRDLTENASDRADEDAARRETIRKDPVCKVLHDFCLTEAEERPVLLVGSAKRSPEAVVSDLAAWMASDQASWEFRRRLIEIDSTSIMDRASGGNPEDRLEELFHKAANWSSATLFFSGFHRYFNEELAGRAFCESLLRFLDETPVSCIAGLTRKAYEKNIENDRTRKRLFQVVQVHDLPGKFVL